jgi:DNA-binding MarR family transcriptional regulator
VTTSLRADRDKSTSEPRTIDVAEREVLRTWLRMLACTNMIEGRVRGELRENFDTTLPRFDLLAQLDAARIDTPNGLTMSELSRRLMVTNGNLTGLVDSLVREGLVGRVVSPQDRRAQLISLTPAGKRGLDSMTPAHAEWIREMFDGLTGAELRQFYRLLGKLKRSAQKTAERPG